MTRIVEKLEFMKARVVKVCAKSGVSSHLKPKNRYVCTHFQKYGLGKDFSWLFGRSYRKIVVTVR
jgi:hypothetical protein